ncbi:carboxypeptidase-like regulatory domain-containing protein [Dyadobacter sp. Leaf189]|uniref:carboxypeptidase-like regulatory domain-containing protein n=1 Tax=Dyadobacter sp. Leaf189 TaxID=1736295 RepID=UPI0006FB4E8D|nr:carboxypeptidase-like regulatory domain-containing protein [Dyadobacter sp. Leaf189]KQS31071.1 hypothetical protein ASG33_11990 [Dyadobacter sp. Leaf189]
MKTNQIKKYLWSSTFCLFAIFVMQKCKSIFSNTTTVYGRITDEKGIPVDSIMVRVVGSKIHGSQNMAETLSDSSGGYEIVVEVAGKFTSVNCLIPPNSPGNVKYKSGYSGYDVYKDGKSAGFSVEKGEKNNIDFKLKSK